jgi:hypothetical protein
MPDEKKDPKTLLSEAIEKRNELNIFIKVLQEMIGGDSTLTPGTGSVTLSGEDIKLRVEAGDPAAVVYPGMFFAKSQPQAVRILLEKVGRPLKVRTILECLEKGGMKVGGKKPAVNMWGVLNRNQEIFVLVPKAGWDLVEHYDPKVIEKMRKQDGKAEEGDEEA